MTIAAGAVTEKVTDSTVESVAVKVTTPEPLVVPVQLVTHEAEPLGLIVTDSPAIGLSRSSTTVTVTVEVATPSASTEAVALIEELVLDTVGVVKLVDAVLTIAAGLLTPKVTDSTAASVTEKVTTPEPSVVPVQLVTQADEPVWVIVTDWPEIATPLTSFTVTVTVDCATPSASTEDVALIDD